jgi:hypothetical protein
MCVMMYKIEITVETSSAKGASEETGWLMVSRAAMYRIPRTELPSVIPMVLFDCIREGNEVRTLNTATIALKIAEG